MTVVPLTAEETVRFEAGAVVYKSLCIGCHQENGQGLDKVAKSIVGSPYVTSANPGSAIRVLLAGERMGLKVPGFHLGNSPSVITSYSIHYTKLYEPRRRAGSSGPRRSAV